MTFVGIEKKTKALVRLQGVRLKVNVPSFIEKNVAFGFDSEAKLFKLEVKENKKNRHEFIQMCKKRCQPNDTGLYMRYSRHEFNP